MVCLTRPAHNSRTNSRRIIKIGSKVAHDMSNIAAMLLHPGGAYRDGRTRRPNLLFVLKYLLFFYQILLYFCTTVAQSSKFHQNRGCFWSLHPQNKNAHCAVSRKRFYSRCVAWAQESYHYWSHRKRSYSISNIGNIIGCDHPSCVPVGPWAGELWHFEYFPTTTVRHFEF